MWLNEFVIDVMPYLLPLNPLKKQINYAISGYLKEDDMNCLNIYLDMVSDYNVVCKLHSLGMNNPHGLELAGYSIECKSSPLPRRWRCTLIAYTTATSHHLLRI